MANISRRGERKNARRSDGNPVRKQWTVYAVYGHSPRAELTQSPRLPRREQPPQPLERVPTQAKGGGSLLSPFPPPIFYPPRHFRDREIFEPKGQDSTVGCRRTQSTSSLHTSMHAPIDSALAGELASTRLWLWHHPRCRPAPPSSSLETRHTSISSRQTRRWYSSLDAR